jgi:hypothetical protein
MLWVSSSQQRAVQRQTMPMSHLQDLLHRCWWAEHPRVLLQDAAEQLQRCRPAAVSHVSAALQMQPACKTNKGQTGVQKPKPLLTTYMYWFNKLH